MGERLAYLLNAVIRVVEHLYGQFGLFPIELAWPAALAPSGSGGGEAGHGALADTAALELRQRRREVEVELPHRGGRIDVFRQYFEMDFTLFQRVDDRDKVDKGPAQAVQLPHDQRVAGAQEAQRIIEARTGFRAAHLVGEYFFAPGFLQGVELEIEILVVGGDTGIADKHGQSLTKLVSSIRL